MNTRQQLLETATLALHQALQSHPELQGNIDPRESGHRAYVDAQGGRLQAGILQIQELWCMVTKVVVIVGHDNTLRLGICWTGTTDRVEYFGDLMEDPRHWPTEIVSWLRKFTATESWVKWLAA